MQRRMAHGRAGRRCLFSCSGTLRSVGASLRLWAAMLRAPLFLKMKHGKLQARKVSLAASMTTSIQGRTAKVRRRAPPPWARPGQQSTAVFKHARHRQACETAAVSLPHCWARLNCWLPENGLLPRVKGTRPPAAANCGTRQALPESSGDP